MGIAANERIINESNKKYVLETASEIILIWKESLFSKNEIAAISAIMTLLAFCLGCFTLDTVSGVYSLMFGVLGRGSL